MNFRLPGFGGGPSFPEPVDREAIREQVERERARDLRQRRGRRSTVLTTPLGVQEQAQELNVQRPSALGE